MSAPVLCPGTVVDGFRLEERIHVGSMAEIWRVAGSDETRFAMKFPLLREGDDPTAIVGFEVEQMILPRLSGVHVPRLVASGDLSVRPYLVMELIAGGSLRGRLEETPLEVREVAALGARIATAVQDLHRQEVVHLDVKPSNVLFRQSGEAVLVDFGLSRHARLPDLLAEEFRIPIGTGPYISPEQVRGIRSDPRSDLFALGVVLYFLATGARPFGNPTTLRGLRRRLYWDPLPPRARNPLVPPWLQEVILRCLEVEVSDRYSAAEQVAIDLARPEGVRVGRRGERLSRDPIWVVARRRFRLRRSEAAESRPSRVGSPGSIVLLAVDLDQGSASLSEAMRRAAKRILRTQSTSRLACVTVRKTSRIAIDSALDEEGHNVHLGLLVALKKWARPIGASASRVTYHVLEAPDPAAAIVEFASVNSVDQVIIGSRGSSTLRRYLGSVSSQVVAQVECTVTVVKPPSTPQEGVPGAP